MHHRAQLGVPQAPMPGSAALAAARKIAKGRLRRGGNFARSIEESGR